MAIDRPDGNRYLVLGCLKGEETGRSTQSTSQTFWRALRCMFHFDRANPLLELVFKYCIDVLQSPAAHTRAEAGPHEFSNLGSGAAACSGGLVAAGGHLGHTQSPERPSASSRHHRSWPAPQPAPHYRRHCCQRTHSCCTVKSMGRTLYGCRRTCRLE